MKYKDIALVGSFGDDESIDKKKIHTIALTDSVYIDVAVKPSGLYYIMQNEDGTKAYSPETGKGIKMNIDENEIFNFCSKSGLIKSLVNLEPCNIRKGMER